MYKDNKHIKLLFNSFIFFHKINMNSARNKCLLREDIRKCLYNAQRMHLCF